MKREIKFKAWDGKKMYDPNNDCCTFKWNCDAKELILMQFTGLLDKNGKEIYEADIINLHQFVQVLGDRMGVSEGEQVLTGIISIDEYGVYFDNSSDDNLSAHLIHFNLHEESLEVIGNIYETTGLLIK